jgi:hypothetical protein
MQRRNQSTQFDHEGILCTGRMTKFFFTPVLNAFENNRNKKNMGKASPLLNEFQSIFCLNVEHRDPTFYELEDIHPIDFEKTIFFQTEISILS